MVDKAALRKTQAPLKERYQSDPLSAVETMTARGTLEPDQLVCRLEPRPNQLNAGLHSMAGGDGSKACSGEMLLDALVACAGVTLLAVSTALEISLVSGTAVAEGELDFRGTLGVDREAPVGFRTILLRFELDTTADDDQLATLCKLTERYCVVAQSLACDLTLEIERKTSET